MTSELLQHEQLLCLSQAAKVATKMLPKRQGGRPVNVSTMHRWVRHGVSGVQLEAACVGGTTATSEAALRRFFTAIAAAKYGASTPAVADSKRKAGRVAAAKKQLAAAGLSV